MTSLLAFKIIAAKLEKLSKTNFAILFVLIIGVVSRIVHVNWSFWLDESWVANSVSSDSLSQMFYYDSWLQTSPPSFYY